MPYLHVHTNVEIKDVDGLLRELSARTAKGLGKPEGYVMIHCSDRHPMLFAGTGEPLAFVELKSLGLSGAQTAGLSAQICDLLQQRLGIDPSRIYIEFAAPERAMWGWDKGTF
jgi:phenylpyruvate tautomerase